MQQRNNRTNRIIRLCITAALVLIAGGLYYLAVIYLGVGIRCPFERLTGYLCPGCGLTRMCMAIMRGDLRAAFRYNRLTFALMPFYAWLAGYLGYRYVVYGDQKLPRWTTALLWVIVAAYIVFGIARNL